MRVFGYIGRYALCSLRRGIDFLALLSVLLRGQFFVAHSSRRRIFYKLYSRQIWLTAVTGLHVSAILSIMVGVLLVFKLPSTATGEKMVPVFSELLVLIFMREVAPVLCAIILIVRSGTAVTAKLGYLNMFKEFDVLTGMGINPVQLFLVPVFFAFPLSMMLLMTYTYAFSIISAEVTLWAINPSFVPGSVMTEVTARMDGNDAITTIIKCLVSGIIIGLYAIRYGSTMREHLVDVTRNISMSATRQLVGVLLANIIISILVYAR